MLSVPPVRSELACEALNGKGEEAKAVEESKMPQDIIYNHHTNCPLKWLSMADEMRSERTNGGEKMLLREGGRTK